MRLSFALFATVVSLGGAWASNVLELTPDNFDNVIGQGKPALVEFFAPWCGHCKKLAPIYEQLADAFAHAKDKVVIAKVDADGEGRPLGQKYGVTGFPTLKWFGPGGGEPEKYEGGRELLDLADYITKMSGVKSSIKPPPPPAYKIVDAHDFDKVVLDPSKDVLVAFTAPWCGHCKALKPNYELVAKDFASEPSCLVVNVDADAQVNRPLAEKYEIGSFPTILFFGKNNKEEPIPYESGRTEADFVQYLNQHCGTHRSVGGLLDETAGRHPEFDSMASRFVAAAHSARSTLFEDAQLIAKAYGSKYKYYLRVMEKLMNSTEDFVEKESKRLHGILEKRKLSPAKLDEVKIKANILSSFKALEEKVEETVGRASDEL